MGTEIVAIPVEIAPGESYTVRAGFRLAEPRTVELPRTRSFTIDPANAVLESKEDNNSAAIDWKSATG